MIVFHVIGNGLKLVGWKQVSPRPNIGTNKRLSNKKRIAYFALFTK